MVLVSFEFPSYFHFTSTSSARDTKVQSHRAIFATFEEQYLAGPIRDFSLRPGALLRRLRRKQAAMAFRRSI